MGVHGLWRLIEPSGKPVPLETLENKILAVDVSIWLHQAVKGFQDSKGAPVPNAHLLGIYHRVCKLLYFKIKPIFVFDGGVPALKRQTIAKRNQLKSRNSSEADRLQKQLLSTLLKHSAISTVLSEKAISSIKGQTKKTSRNDIYELPVPEHDSTLSSSEDEEDSTTDTPDSSPTKNWDLHTIDMKSNHFKSLPVDVRHEILTELKETRKQNSWGRLHEIPKQSDDFSTYQMKRLLQRQSVQAALEEAAKEMGGTSLSLAELESLLNDQGIPTTNEVGKRIASDENTRYLYIKDVKEAIEKARKEQKEKEIVINEDSECNKEEKDCESTNGDVDNTENNYKTKAHLEEEEDLQKAIALSLEAAPSTSQGSSSSKNLQLSFLEGFNDADFQSDSSDEEYVAPLEKKTMSSAANYMMEYSGLTPNEIQKIIGHKTGPVQDKTKVKITSSNRDEKENEAKNKIEVIASVHNENLCDNRNSVEVSHFAESINEDVTSRIYKMSNKNDNSFIGAVQRRKDISKTTLIKVFDNDSSIIETTKPEPTKAETDNEKSKLEICADETSPKIVQEISDSDSDDLMEVADATITEKPFQIQIDPSKTIDDDLFSDIFCQSDKKESKLLEIIIDPEKVEEDDLFSDVFSKHEIKKEVKLDQGTVDEVKEAKATILKTIKELNESKETDSVIKTNEIIKDVDAQETDTVVEAHEIITNQISESVDVGSTETRDNKIKETAKPQLSVQEMNELKDNLQKEKNDLIAEKSTKERLASNITDQMYKEAQELLELFGVPYIIAPMEAEAQCAFLDSIEFTDGTITDDSDIWLFGGRTVYKNFFNQSKYVMEFNAENIKHHFKLSREQLILLALLVGSDYTTGIQGIGPVTALEILSAFPPSRSAEFSLSHSQLLSGLKEFKAWFAKGKTGGIGRSSLRSKLKNIDFSDNFPSRQVVEAYLDPKVETSDEKFSWGKPDIIALTVFARDKFGWSPKKTDEILKPVVKRMEECRNQKSIKDFFRSRMKIHSSKVEDKMSKRVKTALNRFGKTEEELIAEEMLELQKEEKKTKRVKGTSQDHPNRKKTKRKKVSGEDLNENDINEDITTEKEPRSKQSKKNEVDDNTLYASEEKDMEVFEPVLNGSNRKKKPSSIAKRASSKGKKKKVENSENIVMEHSQSQQASIENTQTEEPIDELKLYANLAAELKMRRKRNTELKDNKKEESRWKKKKPQPKLLEQIPEELKEDEDIQMLIAASSISTDKVEKINKAVEEELKKNLSSTKVITHVKTPKPKQEIIHQRLRDRTDLLRNKMKAIEVYRKSKKGPGFVQKGQRKKMTPKNDAELSEDSD